MFLIFLRPCPRHAGEGNRDLNTLGTAVVIESESEVADACRIECAGTPADPHRAFAFTNGEGMGTVIRNLTLAGGYHPDGGGRVLIEGASPHIENCTITGCGTSQFGGGVLCVSGQPTFTEAQEPSRSMRWDDLLDAILLTPHAAPPTILIAGHQHPAPDSVL